MHTQEPCWNGRIARASREALSELFANEDQRRDFLSRLPPEARREQTDPLTANGWYPERNASQAVETAAVVLGRPPADLAREIGRRSMSHQYGGLGMAVASIVMTPSLVVRYAGANWKKFRNNGELVAELVEPGWIRNTIRGWRGHSPALCCGTWGAFEEIWANMRRVRGASVQRTACVAEGADACLLEVRFEH